MRNLALFALLACSVTLTACASKPRYAMSSHQAERVLERAGTVSQPGKVAATDIAFAREARDDGLWTAFRAYAASSALMQGPDGVFDAAGWLHERPDPAEPIRWAPRNVWSSCDGTLAASVGRFVRPNGLVGDYITVWELQRGGEYRWVYDTGTPDDPQPLPQAKDGEPLGPDDILVTALDVIDGKTADCPRGEPVNPPVQLWPGDGGSNGGAESKDKTLSYRWEHGADGSHRVAILWLRNGEWQEAFAMNIPPATK